MSDQPSKTHTAALTADHPLYRHTVVLTAAQHHALLNLLMRDLKGVAPAADNLDRFGALHALANSATHVAHVNDAPTLAYALAVLYHLEALNWGLVKRSYGASTAYGATCLAFATPTPEGAIALAGLPGARLDGLGQDTVVYWPNITD